MKLLVPLFFLMFNAGMAQTQPPLKIEKQQADIHVKGNNNTVQVIQGGKVVVYNLHDKSQYQQFLNHLKTISGYKQEIEKILRYSEKTFSIVSRAVESGVFDQQEFIKIIDSNIRDNERLKIENEQLKKLTTDHDFKRALTEATKRLEVYDNDGYQQILENFIEQNEKKINQTRKESANAAYL